MGKNIEFYNFNFLIENGEITLNGRNFLDIQISGENKNSHAGIKMCHSSEGKSLKYVTHELTQDALTVIQKNNKICVKTFFKAYENFSAISVYSEVENISEENIIIEEMSAFVLPNICGGLDETKNNRTTRNAGNNA